MPKSKGKRKGKHKDGKVTTTDESAGEGAPAPVPRSKEPTKPEEPKKAKGKRGKGKGKGSHYPFKKGRNPELTAAMEAAAAEARRDKLSRECPICKAKGKGKRPSLVPKANVYGGFRFVDASLYGPAMFDGSTTLSVLARDQAHVRALEREHHKKEIVWCCSQACAEDVCYMECYHPEELCKFC